MHWDHSAGASEDSFEVLQERGVVLDCRGAMVPSENGHDFLGLSVGVRLLGSSAWNTVCFRQQRATMRLAHGGVSRTTCFYFKP